MTRKEFLVMAGLLGLGALNAPKVIQAAGVRNVLVIGAGAAGLTAGYRLRQRGIGFQILEASSDYGGRMKRNLGFADFPIPLGAEWLHATPQVFADIATSPRKAVSVQTKGYKRTDDYAFWDGEVLRRTNLGAHPDRKFVNSSWFDFFDQYIIPSVHDKIRFRTPVTSIDTSQGRAIVKTLAGEEFTADAVLVTVPLKMLQERRISFTPPLPQSKIDAIDKAVFWDGYKAFLEFDEQFYPTYTELEVTPEKAGQHIFYDASYGQNTRRFVLGLFAVGRAAQRYLGLSDAAVTRDILRQLDEIFAGQATPRFRKIITQNWSSEPFIGGAYVRDHENWKRVRQLGRPVGAHLFFAGEAYTAGEDWGAVHDAALAAKAVVDQL
ncbi:MAG: NAD(P)/FAD-dependent oxidoreductase [Planktotalea sp.]|uniref:flavin monoamine oxidase family protein n=1 Tax=Planktotalea sp. TaxID=2029877 RepID=UPI003C70B20F